MPRRVSATNLSSCCFCDATVHLPHLTAPCDDVGHEFCTWLWRKTRSVLIPLVDKIASRVGLQTNNVLMHFVEICAWWFHLYATINLHTNSPSGHSNNKTNSPASPWNEPVHTSAPQLLWLPSKRQAPKSPSSNSQWGSAFMSHRTIVKKNKKKKNSFQMDTEASCSNFSLAQHIGIVTLRSHHLCIFCELWT